MLNFILTLVLMFFVCLVFYGIGLLIVSFGFMIFCIVPAIMLFALCYDFVDHMRNG